MDQKILFGDESLQPDPSSPKTGKETPVNANLFPGRLEAELNNASFPDWDIVPPNQFINPRIKKQ